MLRKLIVIMALLLLGLASYVIAQTVVVSVRGVPQIVNRLADEVIFLLDYKKQEINWDKTHVSNYPAGATITLENDAKMLREDWIAQADTVMADLQARIDAINALK